MAIPRGSHYEPGSNRHYVILSDGSRVTRATAENTHARTLGYRSNYEFRQHTAGDRRYFEAWLRTEQGQHARDIARSRGVSERQLRNELIAARNSRPRSSGKVPGTPGKAGGQAFQDFMEDYDLMDTDDWVDY